MAGADQVEPEGVDAAALQFIAEGVTELAGFELAAISVIRDGRLRTVAIAGDDHARAELSALEPPVSAVLAELEHADEWGLLRFVPHERESTALTGYSYVPDYEPSRSPDAWHPRDMLLALLEDDAGELRGVLSVDLPRNGRRPDEEQRRVLEHYARQAGRAVITLLERDDFARGLRRERATSDYRGQLIDALSHQLQNPLAAITGNLELALEELADMAEGQRLERPLRAVERAAGRISTMVQDLLALAEVNNPDRPLKQVDVDLTGLAADVVESLETAAGAAQVDVRLAVSSGRTMAKGDPGELEDLLANLVSNAIKYTDPGGTVTVAVGPVVGEGARGVELVVSDDGIGIAEDDLPRLFEEFFRAKRGAARERPGTGLGLAIVDRVVRRHGGRIDVESELGVGTTFRVRLPVGASS